MAKLVVTSAERRISASTAAVWSVLTDPHSLARIEPRARLVATHGLPGEVGSRYTIAVFGIPIEREVVEAIVGQRLVLHSLSSRDRSVLGEQRGELRSDGDTVVLTWTVTQSPPSMIRGISALTSRLALPRWLAKVAREATKAAK